MRTLPKLTRRAFGAALLLLLVGCGDTGNSPSATQPSAAGGSARADLIFINRGDLITLDLNQMSYMQDMRISMAIREGLYTYDAETLDPIPALAQAAEQSADKKTWTFKLRPDAKWSDGTPVTADDFVFSWNLLLESPGEYTSLLYYVVNAEAYEKSYREQDGKVKPTDVGWRAVDANTLEVKLVNPVAFFPDLMAFPTYAPRHKASMEKFRKIDDKGRASYDDAYTRAENVVLNGPFVFEAWKPGQFVRLKKNEQYWDRATVKLNTVEMIVNNDPQSAFTQYDRKNVDWLADPSPDLAQDMLREKRPDLHTGRAFGTAFLTVNCAPSVPGVVDVNPLADLRVRQALAMTIDKPAICETITQMGETPADRYMPDGFFKGYASEPTVGRDVARAKQLLAEAGYPDGRGFPKIAITYNSESPVRPRYAEFMREGWRKDLGITVDLNPLELKTYRNEITTKRYTLGCVGWFGDYFDVSTFTDKYRSTSQNNDSNWGPPAYDALLDKAAAEPDEAQRFKLLGEAETMIHRELPIIPLYVEMNKMCWRDEEVGGLSVNAKNMVNWKAVYRKGK